MTVCLPQSVASFGTVCDSGAESLHGPCWPQCPSHQVSPGARAARAHFFIKITLATEHPKQSAGSNNPESHQGLSTSWWSAGSLDAKGPVGKQGSCNSCPHTTQPSALACVLCVLSKPVFYRCELLRAVHGRPGIT